jgi:hypothetical protein
MHRWEGEVIMPILFTPRRALVTCASDIDISACPPVGPEDSVWVILAERGRQVAPRLEGKVMLSDESAVMLHFADISGIDDVMEALQAARAHMVQRQGLSAGVVAQQSPRPAPWEPPETPQGG